MKEHLMPKLREWVYVNVYWWSAVDTSAFISGAFRASLQEGLGVCLQRFSGKKDQGTNYETAAVGHSRCCWKTTADSQQRVAWERTSLAEILRSSASQASAHPFTGLGSSQGRSVYPGGCPGPREGAKSAINNHIFA